MANQICTIQDETICHDCVVKGKLNCRYQEKRYYQQTIRTILPIYLPFFSLTLVSFLTGYWWVLIYYAIVYLVVFQSGLNQLWLCRHCPYYSRDCGQLFCGLHNGKRKLATYSPKPAGKLERIVPLLVFPSLQLFPLLGEGYGVWFSYVNRESLGTFPVFVMSILLCIHVAANLRFVFYLRTKMCVRCVNFSCLFNRVSSDVVDAYLEKSPTMKEAWLASGYQMKNNPAEAPNVAGKSDKNV